MYVIRFNNKLYLILYIKKQLNCQEIHNSNYIIITTDKYCSEILSTENVYRKDCIQIYG